MGFPSGTPFFRHYFVKSLTIFTIIFIEIFSTFASSFALFMRGRRGGVEFTLVLQKLLCGYGIVILRRRHAVSLFGGSGMGGVATLENTIATKPNAIIDVSVGKVAGRCDAEPLARLFRLGHLSQTFL
jgi:hypothetical protein